MVDDDLSTYGIVYFDNDDREGVIEVKLAKLVNVTMIAIHGGYYSPLDGIEVSAGETYCGTCGANQVCYIRCSSPVKAKMIFVRKYPPFYHDSLSGEFIKLRIYEIKVYGNEISDEGGVSDGAIAGIAVGASITFILPLTIYLWKRRKAQSLRFYGELAEGYAAARARGERSGQFQIQQQHPGKKSECTLILGDVTRPRHRVRFKITVELVEAALRRCENISEWRVIVRFTMIGIDNFEEEPETSTNMGDTVEMGLRPTVEERPPTLQVQTVREITDLPPPSYQISNEVRNQNYEEIPSYEEVMANSAHFPGVKTSSSDTLNWCHSTML